jgi:hypothetical protein
MSESSSITKILSVILHRPLSPIWLATDSSFWSLVSANTFIARSQISSVLASQLREE